MNPTIHLLAALLIHLPVALTQAWWAGQEQTAGRGASAAMCLMFLAVNLYFAAFNYGRWHAARCGGGGR